MKINEIYTAYVAWNTGGKRRPVLVIRDEQNYVFCYKITSKYKNKSANIRRNYYKIINWSQSGLVQPSYVDIGQMVPLDKERIKFKLIGSLSLIDTNNLAKFIENRYKKDSN